MQAELDAEHPDLNIQLLAIGREDARDASLSGMSALGDLPVLWSPDVGDVWTAWEAGFRDVVILNARNEKVAVFNLSGSGSLGSADNYEALKAALVETAE